VSETNGEHTSQDVFDQANRIKQLSEIADYVRREGFAMVLNAESGHLGGSSSSVELLVGLYFGGYFNFNPDNDKDPNRDRVLIRGHEGPVRYPIFSLLGYIDPDELKTYRRLGSRLQGHEDMHKTPGIDITPSGSLGMLLSYGTGSAYSMKLQGGEQRVVVFLGDGEEQEGNVSEAARHAATLPINNLVCIIDQNGKQLSRRTNYADGAADIEGIWRGYGWDVRRISNGNDVAEVLDVYEGLQNITKPTLVVAKTTKGIGIKGAEEHFSGYHTLSVCEPALVHEAIQTIDSRMGGQVEKERIRLNSKSLVKVPLGRVSIKGSVELRLNIEPRADSNTNLDYSQFHYFQEFRRVIAQNPNVPFYVMTPDFLRSDLVSASQFEEYSHYLDTGLREQHTIAMAHGISTEEPAARIFINYGDAFLYRGLDQVNAAAQGGSNILMLGEYAGVSQAQNGKTHQSISQPGALFNIPEIKYYEPADVLDLYNVLNKALGENSGFTYVRVHPKNVKPLSRSGDDKQNVNSYITHETDRIPGLTIVASGMMVGNCVEAAQKLELEAGISARVVNVVNPKSITEDLVTDQVVPERPLLTVYNGNPMILQAQVSMAVMSSSSPRPSLIVGHGFSEGTSGRISELEEYTELDSIGIIKKALQTLNR